MYGSVEQAFVGRDEPKTAAKEVILIRPIENFSFYYKIYFQLP